MAAAISAVADAAWDAGTTWSSGAVPGINDDVTIGVRNISTPTGAGTSFTVNSIAFGGTGAGSLNISGGKTLTVTTTLNVQGSGMAGVSLNSGGTITVNGNITLGSGTINTTNGTLKILVEILTIQRELLLQ